MVNELNGSMNKKFKQSMLASSTTLSCLDKWTLKKWSNLMLLLKDPTTLITDLAK